jgi:hypothetical protein
LVRALYRDFIENFLFFSKFHRIMSSILNIMQNLIPAFL